MTDNPYQSPAPPPNAAPVRRVRWRHLAMRALLVALASFSIQLAIVAFKPFGVRDDFAPMTPMRQAMAGLALINLVLLLAALGTILVATVGMILSFIRRRICYPPSYLIVQPLEPSPPSATIKGILHPSSFRLHPYLAPDPLHLLDLTLEQLQAWLAERGVPAYRAGQIRRWLLEHRAADFESMSNLPKALRAALAEEFRIWTTEIVAHKHASDGTEKLLLALHDGQRIECVLIREAERRTICISTQVGCAMGCVFCASGLDGVARNLTTGEIIEQMLRLAALLPAEERLSNIVVMGMGEPLANLNNLLPALAVASSPPDSPSSGLGIGHRRITISTVGLPPALDRLTAENCHYHLAVSLHAPNDELRTRLVPVNKNIGIESILAAADRYFEASGRRLTFEYVLLGRLNDRPEHAEQLVKLLRTRLALLNVIPYNPVAGLPYLTPDAADQERFLVILRRGGVNVQVRQRKGDKIDAACGQLRRSQPPAVVPLSTSV